MRKDLYILCTDNTVQYKEGLFKLCECISFFQYKLCCKERMSQYQSELVLAKVLLK
jgi:hypothetical protein